MKQIACPVALHPDGAPLRIAVRIHPADQAKLLKARIKDSKDPAFVAAHKLFDASGLETRNTLHIGTCDTIKSGEQWHFVLCRIAPPVRPSWAHFATGIKSGPKLFKWLDLDTPQGVPSHEPTAKALEWIKAHL